jgi:hypothetical protein
MPECNHRWEQHEWEDGKPKDFNSDLDIRNNNAGRPQGKPGADCMKKCEKQLNKGNLSCGNGKGGIVPCAPSRFMEELPIMSPH